MRDYYSLDKYDGRFAKCSSPDRLVILRYFLKSRRNEAKDDPSKDFSTVDGTGTVQEPSNSVICTIIDKNITELIKELTYLGCSVSFVNNNACNRLKITIDCVEYFIWELKGIFKSSLILINNGRTSTSVEGCGNMTSVKQRKRRTENSEAQVFKSVEPYTTTINHLK